MLQSGRCSCDKPVSLWRQKEAGWNLHWDSSTAESWEMWAGAKSLWAWKRVAVSKGCVRLHSLSYSANTFSKEIHLEMQKLFFFFSCQLYLPWQNPIVSRMGACWLSTNRYQVMGAKRQIRKVFIGLSLCLLVSMSTLNWFELVFLQISGSGGIEWEGEGKEEASELVGFLLLSVQ